MPENAVETVSKEAALPEIRRLINKLSIEAEVDAAQSNRDFALSVLESILSAESEEEVFARQEAGTLSGQDYTNKPFRLRQDNIVWRKSRFTESGFPYYALITVEDIESGESFPLSCGGVSFVGALSRLCELDAFERYESEGGRPLMLTEKETASGFKILMLKPVATAKSATSAGQTSRAKKG